MAPVYRTLRDYPQLKPRTLFSIEHSKLPQEFTSLLELPCGIQLTIFPKETEADEFASARLKEFNAIFTASPPDLVIVQGESPIAFLAANEAVKLNIPVAHFNADVQVTDSRKSSSKSNSADEIADLADLHFAASWSALERLRNKGYKQVHLTGNTLIDTVQYLRKKQAHSHPTLLRGNEPVDNNLKMTGETSALGDGQAAPRIAEIIAHTYLPSIENR